MTKKSLSGFFEDYLKKESLLVDKKALQANYTPDTIPHRGDQIKQIAGIIAPALKLEKPSNLFIYGKTGTGKTLSVKHVINEIKEIVAEKKIPLQTHYLNCKMKRVADTEYRLMAQLASAFGKDVPATGLPTDEIYRIFIEAIDKEKQLVILILDEIDQLVKKAGDEILYNITRINSELKNSEVAFIGISNDLLFTDNLDPRVKSSLSEEEINFPPYNAIQLQDILRTRAKVAFRDGVLQDGVIEKCAAYAAREHGDARRALELLRVAGELAERENVNIVSLKYLDAAEDKIEKDMVSEVLSSQPKQVQMALYAILLLTQDNQKTLYTGDVFEVYKGNCKNAGLKPLTQRRISDILGELDMFGIIHARVISKGRYGRTRQISLAVPPSTIPEINEVLKEGLGL
ncbi:ORC1-type DNA replication protein [Candidatus Woesearchaeota archaeon]|nr:ORC1-type DNA replication protein [Candidatus Woesearchaeota archaeon]